MTTTPEMMEARGHRARVTHSSSARASFERGGGHTPSDTHPDRASTALTVNALKEHYRVFRDMERAVGSLQRQAKAAARRIVSGAHPEWTELPDPQQRRLQVAEATKLCKAIQSTKTTQDHPLREMAWGALAPFYAAMIPMQETRKTMEQEMIRLAKDLPAADWFNRLDGMSIKGFAQIIAEAGDLGKYDSPAKLWKRMGVGFAQLPDGRFERQRKTRDTNLATLMGYSADRRAVLRGRIGDAIKKRPVTRDYRQVYVDRKAYEIAKAEAEGLTVAPAGKIPASKPEQYRSLGHIDNRALRYMEKRILRDLWRQWRREVGGQDPSGTQPHGALGGLRRRTAADPG